MVHSERLIKRTGWLSILALIYVVAGLPLIHPFFHHHCENHCCIAGRHDLNRGFSNDERSLKELQRHADCRICSFLHHFHINHPAKPSVPDYGLCLSKVNLPLDTFLIKRFEPADLLPRPPPTAIA
ncbi:MAG: hypothetical protein JRD04_04860 [Deltaproteobacteria bacterium]|nr:hypothetical protein [Deltaproteobacteria bacterium]